jgi:hypothetical protein
LKRTVRGLGNGGFGHRGRFLRWESTGEGGVCPCSRKSLS